MTTLTLEKLDELAADFDTPGEWRKDGMHKPVAPTRVLIEYARERVAREACLARLPGRGEISLVVFYGARSLASANVPPLDGIGALREMSGLCDSPTAAYLKLLAALKKARR